jgi:hypothetical protein
MTAQSQPEQRPKALTHVTEKVIWSSSRVLGAPLLPVETLDVVAEDRPRDGQAFGNR